MPSPQLLLEYGGNGQCETSNWVGKEENNISCVIAKPDKDSRQKIGAQKKQGFRNT